MVHSITRTQTLIHDGRLCARHFVTATQRAVCRSQTNNHMIDNNTVHFNSRLFWHIKVCIERQMQRIYRYHFIKCTNS